MSSNNMQNLCRVCLDEGELYISEESGQNNLRRKIEACLPISVSEDADFPKKICMTCYQSVNLFYEFWVKSVKADKLLYELLSKNKSDNIQGTVINSIDQSCMQLEHVGEVNEMLGINIIDFAKNASDVGNGDFEFDTCNTAVVGTDLGDVSVEDSSTLSSHLHVNKKRAKTTEIDNSTHVKKNTRARDGKNSAWRKLRKIRFKAVDSDSDNSINYIKLAPDVLYSYSAEGNMFTCSICNKSFKGSNKLERHSLVHTRIYECRKCKSEFKRNCDLVYHIKRMHTSTRPIYKCDLCGHKVKTKHLHKVHMLSHDGIRPFACEECDKGFMTYKELMDHKNVHAGLKPYVCDMCGNSYAMKRSLHTHKRIHQNGEYHCDICKKIYPTKNYVRDHIYSSHINKDKFYTCEVCGKEITTKSGLMVHKKIHDGIKTFACEICGRAFLTKGQMIRHTYLHTGKPITCELCGKSFTTKSALNAHKVIHLDIEDRILFCCPFCDKTYYTKTKLKIHCRKIHGMTKINISNVLTQRFPNYGTLTTGGT